MLVGQLDHQTGTRDVRKLPQLGRSWTLVQVMVLVSCASMAGVPLLFGFIGKEAARTALAGASVPTATASSPAAAVAEVDADVRLRHELRGASSDCRSSGAPSRRPRTDLAFRRPAVMLALPTLVLGLVPSLVNRLATAAQAQSLDPSTDPAHLAIGTGEPRPRAVRDHDRGRRRAVPRPSPGERHPVDR